jgi:hypothetical protein
MPTHDAVQSGHLGLLYSNEWVDALTGGRGNLGPLVADAYRVYHAAGRTQGIKGIKDMTVSVIVVWCCYCYEGPGRSRRG